VAAKATAVVMACVAVEVIICTSSVTMAITTGALEVETTATTVVEAEARAVRGMRRQYAAEDCKVAAADDPSGSETETRN